MLVLHNVRIVPLNVRKNKGTSECDKSSITSNVNTMQYENNIIKCEKKIKNPPNVTKVQSYVTLVLQIVRMAQSNVIKNNGITKSDKSTVACDVGTTKYEDGTIKYVKK